MIIRILNYMGLGVYKRENEEKEVNMKINEEKINEKIRAHKRISKRSKILFVSKKQKIIFKIKRLKKILKKKLSKGNAYEKIYRPPKILLIVLDRGHGKTFKGDVEINKYLDLKNIIDEDEYEYSSLYKLICVSTHSGESSLTRGHYTASCLADNNKYYSFNDTYVKEIDDNNIINNEPYLLFYEQIDIDDKNEINNIKNEIKTIQIIKQLNDYKNKSPDDSINYYKGKNNKSKEKVIYIDNLSSNISTEFKEINSNKNIEQKLDEENKITRNKNLNNINSQYLHYNTYLSKQEEESKNNYNSTKNAKNLQKEFEFESKKLKESNKKYNNRFFPSSYNSSNLLIFFLPASFFLLLSFVFDSFASFEFLLSSFSFCFFPFLLN